MAAPLQMLDAQLKSAAAAAESMVGAMSSGVSGVRAMAGAPFDVPFENVKSFALMPFKMAESLLKPLMAGLPGAPLVPGEVVPATAPIEYVPTEKRAAPEAPAVEMTETVTKETGVAGLFNIVTPRPT